MATRSARSHATGSVTLLLGVLQAHDLDQVSDPDPDDQQHGGDYDEEREPIGPALGGEEVNEVRLPKPAHSSFSPAAPMRATGDSSGDLATARPGDGHRLVLVAVFSVVVHR